MVQKCPKCHESMNLCLQIFPPYIIILNYFLICVCVCVCVCVCDRPKIENPKLSRTSLTKVGQVTKMEED